jgi:hypothetical protein
LQMPVLPERRRHPSVLAGSRPATPSPASWNCSNRDIPSLLDLMPLGY